MRADSKPQPMGAKAIDIRPVEVALAEMDVICAFIDRYLPIVVDDELCARRSAGDESRANLRPQDFPAAILDAQLNELRAGAEQAANPIGAVDDGVEGVERDHARKVVRESIIAPASAPRE